MRDFDTPFLDYVKDRMEKDVQVLRFHNAVLGAMYPVRDDEPDDIDGLAIALADLYGGDE